MAGRSGRLGRLGGLAAVVALAVATTGTAATAGGPSSDPPVGVTDDAINVSVVLGDTSALQQAGVIEKIGDRAQQFDVFADLANEAGGAAGRQLNVTQHTFPAVSTATDQRESCVAATEDDEAFLVMFGGSQVDETMLCAADEHDTISIALASSSIDSTYKAAKGLLFTNDTSANRLMKMWVKAVKKEGLLKGKTVGIVRPDDSAHEEVAKTLKKALDKAGVDVEEEVALPCEGQTCQQGDVGAQRLQTKGVDTLFSLLGAIPYPAFVGAADAIGYKPQYLSSDYEFQVYNTTAKLFGDVKDAYNGAIGISTTVYQAKPDQPATDCNEKYTAATGESFEPLTDGWNSVASMCYMVQSIVDAANAAQEAGGLTQESFVKAYEKTKVVAGKRKGDFTAKKHDAYNTYQLYKFDASGPVWKPINGTVGEDKG